MNTPQSRQDWIYEQLETNGGLTFGEVWSSYRVKWSRVQATFAKDWNKAQQRYREIAVLKEQAMRDAVVGNAAEMAKNGLKTRSERLMLLQQQVDATLADIQDGKTTSVALVDGKPVKYERPHTVHETTLLRNTLHKLQAEISKIEGDYAAEKSIVENLSPQIVIQQVGAIPPPVTREDDINEDI